MTLSLRRSLGLSALVGGLAALLSLAPPASAALGISKRPTPTWQTVGGITSAPPSGRVRAITVMGNTAYFGGLFTKVRRPGKGMTNVTARNHLAALNLNTGGLRPWNPDADANVWAVAADPADHRIYVAGDFKHVGGGTETKIAALDPATGRLIHSFNPRITGRVRAIAIGTDRIYVGGKFLRVQGQAQPYVAALWKDTGKLVTEWRPEVGQLNEPCPPRCTPEVASLAMALDGDSIYIGGHFGLVNGEARNNVARVSVADNEALLQWDPSVLVPVPANPNQKNFVYDISVTTKRVYFCGDFYRVNYGRAGTPNGTGYRSPNLAGVDPTTGARSPDWDTVVTNGGTPACQVSPDGKTLFIGGHFTKIGEPRSYAYTRRHVAAISTASGAAVEGWNPWMNSVLGLHAIYAMNGRVLIGGDFSKAGGSGNANSAFQQGIALFD